MKRLGNVVSIHGTSCLIIKSEVELDQKNTNAFLNIRVLDKNMNIIGKIISIFGSKKQPYFLVYLSKPKSALSVNWNKLYVKN